MKSVQDYTIYYDNDNTTILAKNGVTGANDCKGTVADIVIQCALTLLSAYSQLGGGGGIITQGVKLFISRGFYLITHTLLWNDNTPITIWGEARNRSVLYLANGVNGDLLDIFPSVTANIIEIGYIKIQGNRANQSGTSYCINIASNANELNMYHVEVKDCLTGGVNLGPNGNIGWNSFTDVWFLNDFDGLIIHTQDVRVIGSKFELNTDAGILMGTDAGLSGRYVVSGNLFISNNLGIKWPGTSGDLTVTGNTFVTTTNNNGISITGNLGALTITGNLFDDSLVTMGDTASVDPKVITGNTFTKFAGQKALSFVDFAGGPVNEWSTVVGNTFYVQNTASTIGVYVGQNKDNITITSNQFVMLGASSVAISYFSGTTRLNVIATDNLGYNPIGKTTNFVLGSTIAPWGTSSTVVASTDYVIQATNLLITSTGGTGVSITVKDNLGNTVTGLSALATLTAQYIPQGYKVNFGAFSGAPTVTVFWQ